VEERRHHGRDGTAQLAAGASVSDLTSENGLLFFALDDGSHGRELWVLS
jgi:hypothetical protein